MKNRSKILLALLIVLTLMVGMFTITASAADIEGGTELYLKPNSNWLEANARFAAYFYDSDGNNAWASMTDADADGVYEVIVPEGTWTNVIFCRMNPSATDNNWSNNNKWNQSGDLTYDGTNNLCAINDGQWDCGSNVTWSVFNYVAPTFTVAGSAGLCGTEWDPANTDNSMTYNPLTGLYQIVYTNVPASSYEFKVVRNNSWDASWPSDNYSLTLDEEGKVIITFEPETKTVNAVVGDFAVGGNGYDTLDAAFAAANAGDEVVIYKADTYALGTSGKNITITGAVDGVVFDNIGAKNMGGASVTFNNVTFDYIPNTTYTGLQHSGDLVYNNCVINGTVFLYGTSETFNNCIFNVEGDAYNVWTYGAKEVAFNGCTFNSDGKSVLVYNEGACATDLTVTDTDFIAESSFEGKAAIEIDTSLMPEGTEIVVDAESTATGFATGSVSGSTLWNDKKADNSVTNGGTTSTVVVADETVKKAAVTHLDGAGTEDDPYLINNVDELIWFRDQVDLQLSDGSSQYAGKYFKLTANIDLAGINWNPIGSMTGDHGSFKGVFDGDGHTISNLYVEQAGNGLGLFARTAGNAEINNVKLVNVTVKSTDNSNYLGGLVGNAYASTHINNVHVSGDILISGRGYIGGIAGHGYVVMDNVSVVGNEESLITSTFWCAGGVLGYGGEGATNIMNAHVEGVTITSAAGGLGAIVGMAEDNGGTQPISGSNLSASNVEIKTYVGAYGTAYANYALGYLYGGNPTSELTGNLVVDDVKVETSTGETPVLNDAVATVDGKVYFDWDAALAALEDGSTLTLLTNLELDEVLTINKSITLDGNGFTITQSADCNNSIALLYFENAGNVTVKNVTFDGLNVGAAIRTLYVDLTVDNCVFQNCEHTVGQGLVRLTYGTSVIKNSKFDNNNCSMAISFNWDGDAALCGEDTLLVDNCEFTDNTATKTALIYYVKGVGCTITNSEFVNNTVDSANNCATIYLGFQENCTVTGCLFEGNSVTDASTSTRVAGAIFFGYEANISGNAFINNTAANANGDTLGQVCTSTYYECAIDLSGNYWGGNAPVVGVDYTVQHQTGDGDFALGTYAKTYETDENGNVVVGDVVATNYVAQIGKYYYSTIEEAIAAIGSGDVVIELLADVAIDITAWQTLALGSDTTTSITINGNGKTLTFNKLNSDWNNIATNNDAKLILNNMTITDSGYNNGPWNRYDLNFACDVELNDVVATKALAFKADATLNNVEINEVGDNYAIWIQPNGQTIAIDGLVVNSAGRGIKIDQEYVDAPAKVALSVENAEFTTAKKAAILVKCTAGADIVLANVDISGVAADSVNAVWNDADAGAVYGDITVTGGTLAQEDAADFPIIVKNEDGKIISYYMNLDDLFASDLLDSTDDYTVLLTGDVTASEQFDISDSQVGWNFVTEAQGGVTMTFAYADNWNNIRYMSIGKNITLKANYIFIYGGVLDIFGTANIDYLYARASSVTVKEGGVLNSTEGDATVQVQNNTWLEVYGTLNAGTVNVWNNNTRASTLVVSGENASLTANHIHAWDGGSATKPNTIIVEKGATLSATNLQADRGSEISVDNATVISEGITLGYDNNVGVLDMKNGANLVLNNGGKITAAANATFTMDETCTTNMVATVNSNGEVSYYTVLADAVTAVKDGETIVLISDVEIAEGLIVNGKSVTLDLDGYTLSYGVATYSLRSTPAIITVTGNATLTIDGEGTVLTNGATFSVEEGSKIVILSGTFDFDVTEYLADGLRVAEVPQANGSIYYGVVANNDAPYIKDGYWYVGEYNTGVLAQPVVEIVTGADGQYYWAINGETTDMIAYPIDGINPEITIKNGEWYIDLKDGNGYVPTGVTAAGVDGISITKIEKVGSADNVDTYQISYSDGSTTTFFIYNGLNGNQGPQGATGPQGNKGPQGDRGEAGVNGASNEWLVQNAIIISVVCLLTVAGVVLVLNHKRLNWWN